MCKENNKKYHSKKYMAFMLVIVNLFMIMHPVLNVKAFESKKEKISTMPKTAQEVVNDMGIGWCLGNTLESSDGRNMTTSKLQGNTAESYYETLWENPVTTKAMIDCVKKAGFGAVRVPVSYGDHMDSMGTIDPKWLDRVAEIVSYILQDDMYCIINIHCERWLNADYNEEMVTKYAYVWKQIAERFASVGDKLLFASMNEVRNSQNLYDSVGMGSLAVINQLNQQFVNTVRLAGGENTTRFLVVVPYTAYTLPRILANFQMPRDIVENHLIVEVHSYAALNGLDWVFKCIDKYLVQKGIPVIIGEFGQRADKYSVEQRCHYINYVLYRSDQLGIAPFWWDTGGRADMADKVKAYALLNRNNLTWYFPEIVNTITRHEKNKG